MNEPVKSARLLREIQRLAQERHARVREFLQANGRINMLRGGGALFLGRYYAASDRVYFGMNPGTFGLDMTQERRFEVELCLNNNGPFDFEEQTDFPYWRNMRRFLNAHPELKTWFNAGVTHAFLVPWRTSNAGGLRALNRCTNGLISQYSAELARKIVDDHQPRIVIVAGKATLYMLNEFLGLGLSHEEMAQNTEGTGGTYQWKSHLTRVGFTVLQIPHFARANSLSRLESFASWLRGKLGI